MVQQIVEQERVFKALGNRRRLAIVLLLKKRKLAAVGDIAEAIRLSFKATSKHLGILANANILAKEQQSLQVLYCLAEDMPENTRSVVKLL
jgi:DNA-binding transcriptional ArsR family regulator